MITTAVVVREGQAPPLRRHGGLTFKESVSIRRRNFKPRKLTTIIVSAVQRAERVRVHIYAGKVRNRYCSGSKCYYAAEF